MIDNAHWKWLIYVQVFKSMKQPIIQTSFDEHVNLREGLLRVLISLAHLTEKPKKIYDMPKFVIVLLT